MDLRLFNITRDARAYTLDINGQILNIDTNYVIDNINSDLSQGHYENAIVGLKFLRTAATIRKQSISKLRANQVPGTSLSGGYIGKEYKELLDAIDILLPQVEHTLLRKRQDEMLRRHQRVSVMNQLAERELARRQIFSVMRQMQEQENEDYIDNDLVSQHASSLVRQIRIANAQAISNSKIKIRAYIKSGRSMENPAYYITNEAHGDGGLFNDMFERGSLYREVKYSVLDPIFDVSSEPFKLTFFGGEVHTSPDVLWIRNVDDINTIKDTFDTILRTEDEFFEENFWYRIEFPTTLRPSGARVTAPIQDPRSSELRTQVQALNPQQVNNYPVMSDKNFPHIYFKNTPKIHDENCLVNELIDTYSFTNGNSLSPNTIKEFFIKNPPSIGSLKKFCDAKNYNISLTVLDLAEATLVEDIKKKSRRPAIAFMVHENHVQKYIGDLRSKINLSTEEVGGYKDGRKSFKEKPPKDLTTIGLGKGRRANFSFEFQRNLKIKSLMYEALDVKGEHEVLDICKAFYTCVMTAYPDQAIPKFQVCDEYKPYNGEKIKPLHEYRLKDISAKVNYEKGKSALGGQTDNKMFGFRLGYEINMHRLSRDDISHVRVATDHGKMGDLQKLLEGQDPDNYKYINGLFGQSASGVKTVTFNVNLTDLQLLLVGTPELEYEKLSESEYKVTKTFSHGKYRYLNNFDYHNWVIELCNYHLTKKIDEVMRANHVNLPDLRITKLWVDCVGFNYTASSGMLNTAALDTDGIKFKTEMSYHSGTNVTFKYHDPEVSIAKMKEELNSFFEENKFVGGLAGCGKTYWALRNLPHDFRVSFKNKNVIRISKDDRGEATNKKGQTIHTAFLLCNMKEFYKHCSRTFKNKTVLVDEVSDISSYMWSAFFTCHKLYNTKFIFVGDFKQVPPFGENPDRNNYFWASMMSRTILPPPRPDGKMRCDPDLMKLALGLEADPLHYPIPEELFHTPFYPTVKDHFQFTLECGKEGNRRAMEAKKQTLFPATGGVRVKATANDKSSNYVSGEVYTVVNFWDPNVTLKCEDDDKTITTSVLKYKRNFVPADFQTIVSSQGATVDGVMCIYEIDKIRKSPNAGALLYMAFTRPRHMHQLRLYHTYPEGFNVAPTICEDLEAHSYIKTRPDRVKVVPKVECILELPKVIKQAVTKLVHKVPELTNCLTF